MRSFWGWAIESGMDALRVDKGRRVRDMLIGGFFMFEMPIVAVAEGGVTTALGVCVDAT